MGGGSKRDKMRKNDDQVGSRIGERDTHTHPKDGKCVWEEICSFLKECNDDYEGQRSSSD